MLLITRFVKLIAPQQNFIFLNSKTEHLIKKFKKYVLPFDLLPD